MADNDDMKSEYTREELGKGVRGKFTKQYREGTNVVLLDPDVAKAFSNAKAVNDALRRVMAENKDARK